MNLNALELKAAKLCHPAAHSAIDLGLERVERLLATLGNPQARLPPIIHVAGTNGKGSTRGLSARDAGGRRSAGCMCLPRRI